MYRFDELVYGGTAYTLNALDGINKQVSEELEKNAYTTNLKAFQMINLQKAIIAVGAFSIFDAILQDGLDCRNGFAKAKEILLQRRQLELHNRFQYFIQAINVLKHGKGESYDSLVAKPDLLPFKLKLPNENYFFEGDVSEVATLIEVGDKFVMDCSEIIREVSNAIREACPEFYF